MSERRARHLRLVERPPDSLALKIIYDREGDRSAVEAERQGFQFCRKGCSLCCHTPIVANTGDLTVLAEGIRQLSPDARERLRERAKAYLPELGPEARRAIRANIGLLKLLSLAWPTEGAPCPALEDGRCVLYSHRPLACRTHFAARGDPETGELTGPCERGHPNAALDASGLQHRVVQDNHLVYAGVVGLEIAALMEEIE